MRWSEVLLINLLEHCVEEGADTMAVILQDFIQRDGPLSEEAGAAVRKLLEAAGGADSGGDDGEAVCL